MSKVLKIATLSVAALFLTSSLALAQTTPAPGADAGKPPTSSETTHKGKKKAAKKKTSKKTDATEPAK
jgi:hypothetical protein